MKDNIKTYSVTGLEWKGSSVQIWRVVDAVAVEGILLAIPDGTDDFDKLRQHRLNPRPIR